MDSEQQRDHAEEDWQRAEMRREGEAELRAEAERPASNPPLTVGELTLVLNALRTTALKARTLNLQCRKDAVWARHIGNLPDAEHHDSMAEVARQAAREHEVLHSKLQPRR